MHPQFVMGSLRGLRVGVRCERVEERSREAMRVTLTLPLAWMERIYNPKVSCQVVHVLPQ